MMTGTSIAKKPLRQVATVQELLVNDMAKQQLAVVAAQHMKPERMMRLIAGAMRTTPKLAECEPLTLLGAMMTCASIGLEPNTVLGHAYLIPFGKSVTLIIGYKGMIDLARRSGHVVSIHADVVYEGDEFEFEYGSDQHLRHVPKGARENPIYAYCHAKLTNGEAFTVLPWSVVMGIRDGSQGYKTAIKYGKKDSPWIAHEHQMARKTAVRALFNELPISIDKVSDALEVDDTSPDFQAFAMDPTAGITLDGEVIENEGGAEEEDAGKPGKANDKPAEKKTPAKAAEPEPAGRSDEIQSILDRITGDLDESPNAGEVESILELFAEQIEMIKDRDPEAWEIIDAHADAARERTAG